MERDGKALALRRRAHDAREHLPVRRQVQQRGELGRAADAEWKQRLTPEEYRVLRQAGTEAPFTGEYTDTRTEGVYRCRACGAELFRSDAKFESHCGWPSFYQPTGDDAVVLLEDRSFGQLRTEVRCAACDSHLGHVFEGEGYPVPTDQRWCINSVSLSLEPATDE